MTPEKQEGPYQYGKMCGSVQQVIGPGVDTTEPGAEDFNIAYAQGRASRDAEVAELKAFTSQQTKGTLALIEDNGKLEAENKALKAEVDRLRQAIQVMSEVGEKAVSLMLKKT